MKIRSSAPKFTKSVFKSLKKTPLSLIHFHKLFFLVSHSAKEKPQESSTSIWRTSWNLLGYLETLSTFNAVI